MVQSRIIAAERQVELLRKRLSAAQKHLTTVKETAALETKCESKELFGGSRPIRVVKLRKDEGVPVQYQYEG